MIRILVFIKGPSKPLTSECQGQVFSAVTYHKARSKNYGHNVKDRATIFTNQNCEVTIHESGDLLLTYLDGDPLGVKQDMKGMFKKSSICQILLYAKQREG